MRRDSMVKKRPAAVSKKHHAIKQFEANCWHDEHVRSSNFCCMVVQKGCPALARSSGTLDHVFGDSRLGDLDAELEQLGVDPGCAP